MGRARKHATKRATKHATKRATKRATDETRDETHRGLLGQRLPPVTREALWPLFGRQVVQRYFDESNRRSPGVDLDTERAAKPIKGGARGEHRETRGETMCARLSPRVRESKKDKCVSLRVRAAGSQGVGHFPGLVKDGLVSRRQHDI